VSNVIKLSFTLEDLTDNVKQSACKNMQLRQFFNIVIKLEHNYLIYLRIPEIITLALPVSAKNECKTLIRCMIFIESF
jgi:hypothetical protein